VVTVEGDRMRDGHAFGLPNAHITVTVGRHVSASSLDADWVLAHEMIHLALPAVSDDHTWLAEGLATYVEGIARTQAGNLTETELWQEYRTAMSQGLPQADDQGLDHTHTWARTYWGGALFCLVADVQIRERTHNQRGLQDDLRAISRHEGGMSVRRTAAQILTAGDQATGTTVLGDL
jgi:predicted metalloprotease with PDZ domain